MSNVINGEPWYHRDAEFCPKCGAFNQVWMTTFENDAMGYGALEPERHNFLCLSCGMGWGINVAFVYGEAEAQKIVRELKWLTNP